MKKVFWHSGVDVGPNSQFFVARTRSQQFDQTRYILFFLINVCLGKFVEHLNLKDVSAIYDFTVLDSAFKQFKVFFRPDFNVDAFSRLAEIFKVGIFRELEIFLTQAPHIQYSLSSSVQSSEDFQHTVLRLCTPNSSF